MTIDKFCETYKKYKSGKIADYVFSYLLNEYHVQPNEFLYYSSPYKTADDILKETTNNSDKEYAKRVIDDFFCDINQKKAKNSISWL